MDMQKREEIKALIEKMLGGPVCAEAKAAASAFLRAVGTDAEDESAAALAKELREDITPIEGLLAFAHSQKAVDLFGEAAAKGFAAHAEQIAAAGARICDCPACTAAQKIVEALDG